MPVGRKPKPKAVKEAQGNPGKRPINLFEPAPGAADLAPPEDLDAVGRACWERNAPKLERMGVLTEADVDLLMLYCDTYSQWRRATRALRRMAPTNEEYRKVAVTVEKARDQLRYMAVEFGMSPSSRSRIAVSPRDAVDPFEEFLSGGRNTG